MKSLFTFLAALLMPAFLFAAAPVISETAATVLIGKKAQVTGKVAGDGTDVTVTVHYGIAPTYGATKVVDLTSVSAATGFTAQLTDLTEGATYHYKVVAKNPADPEVETADATFVVPPVLSPTVTATPERGAKATIAGSVVTGGFATSVIVAYGKTTSYGATRTFAVPAAGGAFSGQLTGLEFGTLYHYKVTAKNSGGDGVSTADATFATVPIADPEAKSVTVGNFVADASGNVSARLTANVSGNGNNTTVNVLFGKTSPPTKELAAQSVLKHDVDKLVTFPLTNLEIGETYYYLLTLTKGSDTSPVPGATVATFTVPALNPIFLSFRSQKQTVQQFVNVTSATTAEITVLVDPLGKDAEVSAEFGVASTTTPAPAPTYDRSVSVEGSPDAPAVIPSGKKRSDLKSKVVVTGLTKGTYNYRVTANNGTILPNASGSVTTANLTFTIPGAVDLDVSHKLDGDSATVTAVVSAHGEAVDVVFTLKAAGTDEPVVVRRDASVPDDGVNQPVAVTFGNLTPGTAYTYTVAASHRGDRAAVTRNGAFRTATDFTDTLEGVNSGLIKDAEGNVAGAFKIIGAKGGKFTARVNIGGKSNVVSGELDANGQYRATTTDGFFFAVQASPASGAADAPVKLNFDFVRGDQKYTADVSVNAVTAGRMKELAGLYTVNLPAAGTTGQSSNGLPQGSGFMRMTVKDWGGVSVQGVLGDGSKFSYASTLAGTDSATAIPMWLSPKDARVQGSVVLAGTEADITAVGEFNWYRPEDKGAKRFENGFYTPITASGGIYIPPAKRERILGATTDAASLTFSGGDLASNIVANIGIDRNNRVDLPKGAVTKLTVKPASGTYSGVFENSYNGEKTPFQGVLIPNKSEAPGMFTGVTQTGSVVLKPGSVAPVVTPTPQPQPDPNNSGNPGVDLGNGGLNLNAARQQTTLNPNNGTTGFSSTIMSARETGVIPRTSGTNGQTPGGGRGR